MPDVVSLTPARERKLVRGRADQMQRAVAGIYLTIDGLRPVERLIVLNEVLADELREARAAGVVAIDP